MASKKKSPSILSLVAVGVVVLVAAAGGVYLGQAFGGDKATQIPLEDQVFTNLKFDIGTPFPDIQVTDREYKLHQTQQLLNPNGTVVLFLDDGCPPCEQMVNDWNAMIARGEIDASRVVGITYDAAQKIEDIDRKYELGFPVYADEGFEFFTQHGMDGFPLVVVVNQAGKISRVERDVREEFDAKMLTALWRN